MKSLASFVLSLAVPLAFVGCGGNIINGGSTTGGTSGQAASASASIGAAGGQIALGDNTVKIPAGALSTTTTVTLASAAAAPAPAQAVAVGAALLLGPASTTFGAPCTVTLSFDPHLLPPASSLTDVVILTAPSGSSTYTSLGGTPVDATHVSATTTSPGVFLAAVQAEAVPGYPGHRTQWGVANGQVFPDFSLAGGAVPNFSTTPTLDSTTNLSSEFTFMALHQAAAKGFRYAFIDISAVWCPHCNDEAKTLPTQYVPTWLAQGGVVFSILVQGNDPVQPATQSDLINWITGYKVNYPMSIDAEENMVSGTGLNAWPANIIVRLSDMVVIDSVFGATDAFYSEFSSVLTQCQTSADCWSGATCTANACHN